MFIVRSMGQSIVEAIMKLIWPKRAWGGAAIAAFGGMVLYVGVWISLDYAVPPTKVGGSSGDAPWWAVSLLLAGVALSLVGLAHVVVGAIRWSWMSIRKWRMGA
jgi:hypothetical protein